MSTSKYKLQRLAIEWTEAKYPNVSIDLIGECNYEDISAAKVLRKHWWQNFVCITVSCTTDHRNGNTQV